MPSPVPHPLRIVARVKAFMLSVRILVLGFVCIEWDWKTMLLTLVVWSFSERLLADSIFDNYVKEMGCPPGCRHGEDDHG